jgi:uncharacterized protein
VPGRRGRAGEAALTSAAVERLTLPVDDPSTDGVSAAVHRPEHRPEHARGSGILLVPGAGGTLDGEGLTALATLFAALGHTTVRANLPYREVGRPPPRAERSVAPFGRVVAAAQQALPDVSSPWIVGGGSYGGRVATMAVAEGHPAAGVVCYGYPLHPPGRPDRLRVAHWPAVAAPLLFLQGDRDPFCDLGLLRSHLDRLPRPTLHVVAGGDHVLRVTKRASPAGTASAPAVTIAGLRTVVAGWLRSLGMTSSRD